MEVDRKWRILLIDDDEDDFILLQQTFQQECPECQIECVGDGESLRLYRQQQALRPSIILLDINLPRLNGREILRELKADFNWRSIPVIIYSSSQLPGEVQSCYAEGASAYLVKPAEIRQLKQFAQAIRLFWFETALLPF